MNFDSLTNEGLIDHMWIDYRLYSLATIHINELALWKRWIRR